MEAVEIISFAFFGITCVITLIWFYLLNKLYNLIKNNHPEKYQDMGEPTLFLNNSISESIAFMRYLFKKEWQLLDDSELSSLSSLMRKIFIGYLIIFIPAIIILPIFLMP